MQDKFNSTTMNLDTKHIIENIPFLAGFPESIIKKVTRNIVSRSHPANQMVLLENDWGGAVYFIIDGWVKIRTYNIDGKEVTLNILGKGEIFGEMAAIEELPRSTDVLTLVPTTISTIPSQDFLELIYSEPLAGIHLAQMMSKRLRQVNRRLQVREAKSTSRVADALLFLAEGQGEKSVQGTAIPNLPHRELSGISGLARETVTRALSKLEHQGLIRREGNLLYIKDVEALRKSVI